MRPSRFLFSVVAVLVLLGWGQPAWAEQRLALVIGNGAYHGVPLTAPVGDSRAMAKALRGIGFEVILRESLTKSQMEEVLDDFSGRLNPGAIAVFYYSGRAVQVNGKNYLVPVDAEMASKGAIPVDTVDVGKMVDQLAATRSRVQLLILDACRDDPIQQRVPGIAPGLAAMKAPAATVIALSAAPGKTADDTGRYEAELAKAMKTPGLSLTQMFQQVQSAVASGTDQAQVPWTASAVTETVTLVDAAPVAATETPMAAPVRPPPPPLVTGAEAEELALWLSIKDSREAAAFQGYLARYPAGRYVVMARNSLRLLQQKTALLVTVPKPPVPTFQPPSPVRQSYEAADSALRRQFDQARKLLRDGDSVQAEAAFRRFVADHHDSPLAANAQYWVGESLYVRGRFAEAAAAFAEGLAAYPQSPRAAESLLKLAQSQKVLARMDSSGRLDTRRKAEACKSFAGVISRFPDAPEAVKAKAERTRLSCPAG